MNDLTAVAWPLERLGEAVESLARHAKLEPATGVTLPVPLRAEPDLDALDHWLDQACARLGVEMEAVDASAAEIVKLLHGAAPALLRYLHADTFYMLLLVGTTAQAVQLLGPDLRITSIPVERVKEAFCAKAEKQVIGEIEAALEHANIAEPHFSRARRAMLQDRLSAHRYGGCWLLRMQPTAGFWRQLCLGRVPQRLLAALSLFAVLYALEIAGWWVIGVGALNGRLDLGWLTAWFLLLLGMVPLRLAAGWLQGTLAIRAGALLKQRLLAGALRTNMRELRQQGAGQLLSRVIESQALESLALNGGFGVLLALLELCLAAWVLALGAGGGWHVLILCAFLATTAVMARRYYQELRRWARARLDLTHELVERMVGHRTRMVQETSAERHAGEDDKLEQYLHRSAHFDRALLPLAGGVPRAWLIIGLLGLFLPFISDTTDATALGVGLGGVLLAHRALITVASGIAALLRAVSAAQEVAPLFAKANQDSADTAAGPLSLTTTSESLPADASTVLVQARDVAFRHRAHSGPVLDRCNLTIHRGDRLLLEGASGSGKSTLGALLTGLQRPDSGLLLLGGLDRATLGDSWRRSSTGAPQFQENHVLTGTLAFNLLMGRRWPASRADLAEAEQLCRELGLGELLDRMPSGLMQMVGETGWQLSHGERSRLYLARALLQKAPLVVLDESFAALDPDTSERCLRCALSRAATLLVIAHP